MCIYSRTRGLTRCNSQRNPPLPASAPFVKLHTHGCNDDVVLRLTQDHAQDMISAASTHESSHDSCNPPAIVSCGFHQMEPTIRLTSFTTHCWQPFTRNGRRVHLVADPAHEAHDSFLADMAASRALAITPVPATCHFCLGASARKLEKPRPMLLPRAGLEACASSISCCSSLVFGSGLKVYLEEKATH